jgi:hypothetical protein
LTSGITCPYIDTVLGFEAFVELLIVIFRVIALSLMRLQHVLEFTIARVRHLQLLLRWHCEERSVPCHPFSRMLHLRSLLDYIQFVTMNLMSLHLEATWTLP